MATNVDIKNEMTLILKRKQTPSTRLKNEENMKKKKRWDFSNLEKDDVDRLWQ